MKTSKPTALITGATKRIGKAIALAFAKRGCNIILHYNQSHKAAEALKITLNHIAPRSYLTVQADLTDKSTISKLINHAFKNFGRLDYLINNASIYYPTPIASHETSLLIPLLNTNLFAPARLTQQASPLLQVNKGSVVNLIDIYADAGLAEYSSYVAAKSALKTITLAQARQFSPRVRVNGVSPGAILWPDTPPSGRATTSPPDDTKKETIIKQSALKRLGKPENIAATVAYLALDAHYTTGSIINVDGGRRDYI